MAFRDQAITFSLSGEERPFPLDLVRGIVPEHEWEVIEAGVTQRVRALEAFLADVYGAAHILRDGVIDRAWCSHPASYCREAAGIEPPNGRPVHVAGVDLVVTRRQLPGPRGQLADAVGHLVRDREPAGDDPRVPEFFTSHRVRSVLDFPPACSRRCGAPLPRTAPTRLWWCSRPAWPTAPTSSTSSWPVRWGGAGRGRDLICRDGVSPCAPPTGRPGSTSSTAASTTTTSTRWPLPPGFAPRLPGDPRAARRATWPSPTPRATAWPTTRPLPARAHLHRLLPREKPILANVPTYNLEDPEQLVHVARTPRHLVLKPVDGSGGKGLVIGPRPRRRSWSSCGPAWPPTREDGSRRR